MDQFLALRSLRITILRRLLTPRSWGNLLSVPGRPARKPENVHRSRPCADAAQAVGDRGRGNLAGPARSLQRRLTEGEAGRQGRGVRAARAVGSAVGVALALDQHGLPAVEKDVGD